MYYVKVNPDIPPKRDRRLMTILSEHDKLRFVMPYGWKIHMNFPG